MLMTTVLGVDTKEDGRGLISIRSVNRLGRTMLNLRLNNICVSD